MEVHDEEDNKHNVYSYENGLVSFIDYINEGKEKHEKVTMFHAIITAVAKTIYNRPLLNRFISGQRYYDRKEVSFGFVAKNIESMGTRVYGALVDMDGNFIYSRYSNKVTALLCHAKKISDLIVENGFQLGTPTKNPAVDNSELLINGDSYVGWVLYNCGYSEGQPSEGGLKLNKPGSEGNLADFCAAQGFEKVTNINDLKAGDIVFYGEVDGIEGFAGGVSILASDAFEDDTNYIYDYCYNLRMEEMQPMRESVVDFMFAYRIG